MNIWKFRNGKLQFIFGVVNQFFPSIVSLIIVNLIINSQTKLYLIYLVSFGFVNLFIDYSFSSIVPFISSKYGINKINVNLIKQILLLRVSGSIIISIAIGAYLYYNSFTFFTILIFCITSVLSALTPIVLWFMFDKLSEFYIISISSKVIQLIIIFLFKTKLNINIVLVSINSYYLIIILYYIKIYSKVFDINYFARLDKYISSLKLLKVGWHFFVGRLITSCYTIILPMIIPFLLAGSELADFLLTEKLIRVFAYPQIPLQLKTYKDLSNIFREGGSNIRNRCYKYIILYFGIFICVPILFYFFGRDLLLIVVPLKVNSRIIYYSKIASFIVPLIALSNVLGLQILPLLGKVKIVNWVLLFTALITLILYLTLTKHFGGLGAIYTLVISEAIITGLLFYVFFRTKNYG